MHIQDACLYVPYQYTLSTQCIYCPSPPTLSPTLSTHPLHPLSIHPFNPPTFQPPLLPTHRIPVYIYDDHPWLPYEGTNLSISSFGFSGQMGRLQQTAKALKHAGASDAQVSLALTLTLTLAQ